MGKWKFVQSFLPSPTSPIYVCRALAWFNGKGLTHLTLGRRQYIFLSFLPVEAHTVELHIET